MTAVLLDSILSASAGFIYVGEVAIFISTGPFVDNVMFMVGLGFIFVVHKDGFKCAGSFENDLQSGMLDNSSEFSTEARDIWVGD